MGREAGLRLGWADTVPLGSASSQSTGCGPLSLSLGSQFSPHSDASWKAAPLPQPSPCEQKGISPSSWPGPWGPLPWCYIGLPPDIDSLKEHTGFVVGPRSNHQWLLGRPARQVSAAELSKEQVLSMHRSFELRWSLCGPKSPVNLCLGICCLKSPRILHNSFSWL